MEYRFELTGRMPILFHKDDVEEADRLKEWRGATKNKNVSVPGDDRSPPWTWQTYLHHDGRHIAVPQDAIMKALSVAGAKIKIPNKGNANFKSLSQSGLLIPTEHCRFTVGGEQVPVAPIWAMAEDSFHDQSEKAKGMGFSLFVKRAKIGQTKHVRVRARFDEWAVDGVIAVMEDAITPAVLEEMFDIAGRLAGLLDWRPSSSKSPGPFGTFRAILTLIEARGRKAM